MTLPIDNRFVKLTIEKSIRELPPLPAVVGKILIELEQPDVSMSAIEDLISKDVALSAKVLRVVNSAYYGVSGQIAASARRW